MKFSIRYGLGSLVNLRPINITTTTKKIQRNNNKNSTKIMRIKPSSFILKVI
ncbi:MAG TPA: hypothetical protein VFP49_02900 [Nitrososphaeraceae archaeon]|nr:hypothetical protein [Nitrososphaeraceae archaeon]